MDENFDATAEHVALKVRFSAQYPCPICGGHDRKPRGQGKRCFGFQSGDYANCTRVEYAGGLSENSFSQTYSHYLIGYCRCGTRHDPRPAFKDRKRKQRSEDRPTVIEADYVYEDPDGSPLIRQRRLKYTDADGGKTFVLQRFEAGQWKTGLGSVRPILYRLPELLKTPIDETVFIPEGEKNCESLRDVGLTATTNPMGAGKFLPEYAEHLRGRRVVILEDNDEAGRRHALDVATKLHGIAASIKILDFPELPEHGDVSDYLDADNDVEALINLVEARSEWKPTPFAQFAAGTESPDESEVSLPFPRSAWRGLFGEYRDIVAHTTEASDVFHYWMMAVMLGITFGRRIAVQHASCLYPNFYVVLVGTSGWARKDTAYNRAEILLDLLHADDDRERPILKKVYGVGSIEGFLDKVSGSKAALLRLPEFASLLRKGKQEATSNIIPTLTVIYDCPSVAENPTRSSQLIWKEPFLSIAAGSTKEWLQRSLSESDIKGGFGNRFIYALGERKAPLPYPPPVDLKQLANLAKAINEIRAWVNSLEADERVLHASEDAKALFTDWYEPFYVQASGEGIIASLAVRMQDFAWKLALLYAVCDRSLEILPVHLGAALKVVDWQREANRAIFADFTGSNRELEFRIIARLEAAPGRSILDRDMYRSLKISSGRLSQIYKGMGDIGLVRLTQIDGRPCHVLVG